MSEPTPIKDAYGRSPCPYCGGMFDFNSEGHGPVHICDPMFMDKVRENHAQKAVIKDLLEALKEARFRMDGYSSVDFIDKAIQKAQELAGEKE